MVGSRPASLENDDGAYRSPMDRVGRKLLRDIGWTVRQGFFIRQVLGGGAERWMKALKRRTVAKRGVRRAFNVFLEFMVGSFWFLLYSLVLLVAPGYDAISNDDRGNRKDDE